MIRSRTFLAGCSLLLIRALIVLSSHGTAGAGLLDDFDTNTAPATASGDTPGATVITSTAPGEGNALRLIHASTGGLNNYYSYDRTDTGAFSTITADFDFRGNGTADGYSFSLIPTATSGTTGAGPTFPQEERPAAAGVLGVGFRAYNANNVHLYWDNSEHGHKGVAAADVNIKDGSWNHATVTVQQIGPGSNVTIALQGASTTVTPISQYIHGLLPFENRVQFAGRTGGEKMDADFDNIDVQYSNAYVAPPTLSPTTMLQDFDSLGTTPFRTLQADSSPGPLVQSGGPTGNFLRLTNDGVGGQNNRVSFDRAVDAGVSNTFKTTFDFRADAAGSAADGFSIALLPTATYGLGGNGPTYTAEEPNETGVLGIGFDLWQNLNNVSIHYGDQIAEVMVPVGDLDIDAGVFHQAEVIARQVAGGSNVSVTLTPDVHGTPGTPVTVFQDQFVAGLTPYDYRLHLAGRTGGATHSSDLDNISTGTAPVAQADVHTVQTFDGDGSQYKAYTQPASSGGYASADSRPATLEDAGGGNTVLRLLHSQNNQRNMVGFDRTAQGAYGHVNAAFDMSIGTGADGASFALLDTATYGNSGAAPGLVLTEEAKADDSFGVGFQIYGKNDVVLYWNGSEVARNGSFDYRDNTLNAINVDIDYVSGGAYVDLSIAGNAIYTDQWIADMVPRESRVAFGSRTGGVNTTLDLDNVNVQFSRDSFVWENDVVGNWTEAAKWDLNSTPSVADDALIPHGTVNVGNLRVNGGTITVEGTGALENTGSLQVGIGPNGSGTLAQTGGSVHSTGDLYLANSVNETPAATGAYDLSGGTLTVDGMHTVVGRGGVGTMTQSGDSTAGVRRLFISEFGGSAGSTYTIDDGTLNISRFLHVGRSETGTFTQNGGTVNAMDMTDGQSILINQGEYILAGGDLNADTIKTTGPGAFTFTGGRLEADTLDLTLTQDGGTLAPGPAIDQTDILGDYLFNAGILEIELAGYDQGDQNPLPPADDDLGFDFVNVTGTATLDGTLELSVLDGFTPMLGDTFDVLAADSINLQAGFGITLGSENTWDGRWSARLIDLAGGGQMLRLTAVPEPGSILLLTLGAMLVALTIRRRRSLESRL